MHYAFDIPKFVEWVVESWAPVAMLADRAAYSRSHFTRAFSRAVGESPRGLRNRLRLEAAAHLLRKTGFKVGEVAVEVGYQTPEAFVKAFRRAFGTTPSCFRSEPRESIWLESPNGIHFHASGLIVRRQGATKMNLSEILFRQHSDDISRILHAMSGLNDKQLDADTVPLSDTIPWDKHGKSLRSLMRSIVFTNMIWLSAFKGDALPEISASPSVEELKECHASSGTTLADFVKEVDEKGLWESEFVDALCEEPVRFVFGAVLAHIAVFGAHRRLLALAALRKLGVRGLEYGDPINWLRQVRCEPVYVPMCE
jgi:AraC family transcriptional regulator